MKSLTLFAIVFTLNSCIGIYRDTKAACIWTKEKVQGSCGGGGSYDGGGGEYEYGAPVY